MPKVEAWMCPDTGKLFALDKIDKYRAHLKKVAAKRYTERKHARHRAAVTRVVANLWARATSFEEIEQFLVENCEMIFAQSARWHTHEHNGNPKPVPKLVSVSFKGMRWDADVSNTHSAPRGRPTNWMNKAGLPFGYPGWEGSITLTYADKRSTLGCGALGLIGIHTGSGGSGDGIHYRYDMNLFDEDWTGMSFMHALMRPPK